MTRSQASASPTPPPPAGPLTAAIVGTRSLASLSLRASGLYLDTEVTKDFLNFDPFGVAANFRGNSYPFSPRWSFQASADYETAVSSELNMFAGASISSQSSSTSAFGGAPNNRVRGC